MLVRILMGVLAFSLVACGGGTGGSGLDSRELSVSVPTDTLRVQERGTLSIYLTAIGAEDRPVTFSLHEAPSYASLAGNMVTLSPQVGDAGVASFSVTASDGVSTATGVLTVEVTPWVSSLPPTPVTGSMGVFNQDGTALYYDQQVGHYSRGVPKFKLRATDPEADAYRVLVEVRLRDTPFQGTPTHDSGLLPSGEWAVMPLTGLVEGQYYKVQWRLEDARGAWTAWGANGVNVGDWKVTHLSGDMPYPNKLPLIDGNFSIRNEDMTFLFHDAQLGHYSRGEPRFWLRATDPEGDSYRVFLEVRPESEPFQQTATHESGVVPSADPAVVPMPGLVEGVRYKMQWRLEDARGAGTNWYFSWIDVSVWTVTDL